MPFWLQSDDLGGRGGGVKLYDFPFFLLFLSVLLQQTYSPNGSTNHCGQWFKQRVSTLSRLLLGTQLQHTRFRGSFSPKTPFLAHFWQIAPIRQS